ncbi:hypothetical protein FJT64_026274 [Amphibalanus amphitrite]|uniref:Gustatory receptor n=1 Tax=Amphibalanus amphitrite TaxID=1232801 RepID=A0A6A4W4Y4_AMPAM|nr:hypothetical protein FJT64_026274 [Amphibalanus amphitrite]
MLCRSLDSETPETPERQQQEEEHLPVGSRAFVVLLRLAGLAGRPGWGAGLYAGLLCGLLTWVAVVSVRSQFDVGQEMVGSTGSWSRAAASSGFFGAILAEVWLTLVIAYITGRRRCAEESFSELMTVLHRAGELVRGAGCTARQHLEMLTIWALVGLISIGNVGVAIYDDGKVSVCNEFSTTCVHHIVTGAGFGCLIQVFLLIPMKFLFIAFVLARGLELANEDLEELVIYEPEDAEDRLRRNGEFQKRYVSSFLQLTDAMAAVLLLSMLYGVLTEVALLMSLINALSAGGSSAFVVDTALFLLSAGVSLLGPCEACQRLLALAGRRCDLLLELEWRRPRLAQQAGLQRAAALRHLDTIGDLGFFQVRRATLLAVTSTIITYIVIIAQFQATEDGCHCPDPPTGNASALP